MKPLDPARKAALTASYAAARCDLLIDGAWLPLRGLPTQPMIALSAWNPGGEPAPGADNARHDERLRKDLIRLGFSPKRVRGRQERPEAAEEAWMVAYDPGLAIDLLAAYDQLAALIFRPRGRAILWCDGEETLLDGASCQVPAAPARADGRAHS